MRRRNPAGVKAKQVLRHLTYTTLPASIRRGSTTAYGGSCALPASDGAISMVAATGIGQQTGTSQCRSAPLRGLSGVKTGRFAPRFNDTASRDLLERRP